MKKFLAVQLPKFAAVEEHITFVSIQKPYIGAAPNGRAERKTRYFSIEQSPFERW